MGHQNGVWVTKVWVLIMKKEKVVSEEISMPGGKMMKNIEEGGYKYLGILEVDGVKHAEIKDQKKKEYLRRVRNILKSKLNEGNIILAINLRAVSIVRYGAGMTMYGAHHPKQMLIDCTCRDVKEGEVY